METVVAMYDRAAAEYEAAKADVEKRMTNPNNRAAGDQWEKLDEAANTARFTRHMADYYLALSLLKSANGLAERAKIAGMLPERFAMENLGHNSKAVHRAYAKRALMKIPSPEEYEQKNVKTSAF